MSRNELINALIRVIGIYILVVALLEVPAVVFGTFSALFEFFRTSVRATFGDAFERFSLLNILVSLLTLTLRILLGYYLMCGGKWFADKATRE